MAALDQELSAMLKRSGCYIARAGKGSHEIWFSPITGRSFSVPKTVASHHTANAILKQAGLPKSF